MHSTAVWSSHGAADSEVNSISRPIIVWQSSIYQRPLAPTPDILRSGRQNCYSIGKNYWEKLSWIPVFISISLEDPWLTKGLIWIITLQNNCAFNQISEQNNCRRFGPICRRLFPENITTEIGFPDILGNTMQCLVYFVFLFLSFGHCSITVGLWLRQT